MKYRTLLLTAALIAPVHAHAQAAPTAPAAVPTAAPATPAGAPGAMTDAQRQAAIAKAPALFFQVLAPNRKVDAILTTMDGLLSQIDTDHNGTIDGADLKAVEDMQALRARVGKVGRLLSYDIHNNGKVTRADVEAGVRRETQPAAQVPAAMQARVEAIMRADLNHDGTIDFEEMRTLAPEEARPPVRNPVEQILTLSANGKSVSVDEVRATFRAFVAAIDADNDGMVSEAEYKAVQSQAQAAIAASRIAPAPQPPAAATVPAKPAKPAAK